MEQGMKPADLLLARIQQLEENTRHVVAAYMTWYTFFWTLNLAALAFLFQAGLSGDPSLNDTTGKSQVVPFDVVAWVFFGMNLPACGTSFFLLLSLRNRVASVSRLTAQLVRRVCSDLPDLRESSWPMGFICWGLIINGLGTFALVVVWGYVALR
jgi:hypothetical protein